jgi:hypothetical protein
MITFEIDGKIELTQNILSSGDAMKISLSKWYIGGMYGYDKKGKIVLMQESKTFVKLNI